MPKRRTPSAIFTAWDRIVFQERLPDGTLPPAAVEEWEALWREHIEGDRLTQTAVRDTELLCRLGWELAAQRGDWESALACVRRVVNHPKWQQLDEVERQETLARVAMTRLFVGDVETATEELGALLAMQRPYRRLPLVLVRGALYHGCAALPTSEAAPADLARLVVEVIQRSGGGVRATDNIVPGVATYGKLVTAIENHALPRMA